MADRVRRRRLRVRWHALKRLGLPGRVPEKPQHRAGLVVDASGEGEAVVKALIELRRHYGRHVIVVDPWATPESAVR